MTIAIESLSLLELKAFLREQALDAFPALQDEGRLTMLAEKWHTHAEFCTCRDEGILVGMIAFYANQPECGVAYIPHVYVSPGFRRQGAFRQMLQTVESNIEKKGFKEVKLEVQNENTRAQKAYLKYGFSVLSTSDDNSIYMNKLLNPTQND